MPAPKLLLVEDDLALAELLEYRFESEGYDVRVTADGDEALILAAEETPDLVILDWMIEGTSGIEVCRRLRRDKSTAHVPIIMLTAREAEDDRVRGLDTGADDYVTKPFSPRELLARVAAVLRRLRPALAGEAIEVGDLRLDPVAHRVEQLAAREHAPGMLHQELEQPVFGRADPQGLAVPLDPVRHRIELEIAGFERLAR